MNDVAHAGQAGTSLGELTSFTVDVTSALAFGHDLNTLERPDNELQAHLQRIFDMLSRRIFAPVPDRRWVKLPADRALERSLVYVQSAVEEFIEQARERMASRPGLREAPENFLEAMLAAQETEATFTDEEIIGSSSPSCSPVRTPQRIQWAGRSGSWRAVQKSKTAGQTRRVRSWAQDQFPG